MNIFRLVGDLMHLTSILILLFKITKYRNCKGISLKSQLLYLLVFCTRYLDLFTRYYSLYNHIMKIFFIASSAAVVVQVKYSRTYDVQNDKFRIRFLIIPCLFLALIFKENWTIIEYFWSFSEFLEAVAIMPQLFMLQQTGEAEAITTHYLFALGAYRGLYILNWVWRYFAEGYVSWVSWTTGIVQTALYSDFFYHYFTKVMQGKKFTLPK